MNAALWSVWGGMAAGTGMFGWAWNKAGPRSRRWLEWGLAALVAGISLSSVLTHEPWRDELHAWLQARDMTLGQLWGEMACEGHFLPWYLLLYPFAHWGAPAWTMGVVSWALNAVAVSWLARKSPLTGWEKAAVGLSCLFLYVNPVIARCYVLVPLALFALASLWEKRDECPVAFGLWVALLSNTHLYMEGMAVALFGVYAWENILRRKDGKGWRECRRQWTGLGVMAAGGALALMQVLPSLWKSAVKPGHAPSFREDTAWFFQGCISDWAAVAVVAGLAVLGVVAWKKDRGAFGVYVAGLAYMWGFALFLHHAAVLNRSLLWWPVALFAAWVAAGRGGGDVRWRVFAVVVAGLSIARPGMTWDDWRGEHDSLRGACRWIAEQYGTESQVWINGGDFATEPAAVYLSGVMDWRTGKRAEPMSWGRGKHAVPPFRVCAEAVFRAFPGQASFLALCSTGPFCGLTEDDFARSGVVVEKAWTRAVSPQAEALALLRVRRWGRDWGDFGMERYQAGDRAGAVEAWARAVEEDAGGAWEAMNNLAWVALEEGRVAAAREWIDRAMACEEARQSAEVLDTEAAVRRTEGGGTGNTGTLHP